MDRRPLVLVAEDDPSIRMAIEFVLTDEGFGVLIAEDGQRALDLARAHGPDIILLDHKMPKLEGPEVYRELRRSDATRGIPVFVMTGMSYGAADDWAGAHFIGKPFSPDDLVARIRGVLG